MKIYKSTLRLLSLIVLLFSFVSTQSIANEGVTKDKITIGGIGALSGPYYLYGELVINGAEAVFKEAGAINGRTIELKKQDSMCKGEGSIAAVKKSIAEDNPFMFVGFGCSNATLASQSIVLEAGIPSIVAGATNDKVTTPNNGLYFRVVMKASEEGAMQANFVSTIPNVKRVAVVTQKDAWGTAKWEGFMSAAKSKGLDVVAVEEMTLDTLDATAQALRIKKANPDAVVTILYPKPTIVFLRSAHQLGLTKLPTIGHTSVSDIKDLDKKVNLPGALDNFYTISLTSFTPGEPEAAKVTAMLKKHLPNQELTQYHLWGVAAGELIVEALKRAGKDLTRKKIVETLRSIDSFQTSTYPAPLSFSKTDHDGYQMGLFTKLENGKVIKVGISYK
jgi:branched-chain amino acid transport system substrate-binding protein